MVISQREARRLRKRVAELENREAIRNRRWGSEYPGGIHLDTVEVRPVEYVVVTTARKLGHACVVVPDKVNYLRIYGMKP